MKRTLVVILVLVAACSSATWSFPGEIKGYRLLKLVKGKEALREINRLHGKRIQAVKGAIAVYVEENKRAMIWVSQAPSEEVASQQVKLMINKMNKGGSPFFHFSTGRIGCLSFLHFLGLGQEHYLFAKGTSVYWISAPIGDGKAFLRVFARKGCPFNL